MPSNNFHTPQLREFVGQGGLPFDLGLARRLVLRCASEAASAKSWAPTLSSRLQAQKPITDATRDVTCRIADEIEPTAPDLKALAERLDGSLG
jgi:hypothetical protein